MPVKIKNLNLEWTQICLFIDQGTKSIICKGFGVSLINNEKTKNAKKCPQSFARPGSSSPVFFFQ